MPGARRSITPRTFPIPRRAVPAALLAVLSFVASAPGAARPPGPLEAVPPCAGRIEQPRPVDPAALPWSERLDRNGVLLGYSFRLGSRTVRVGPDAFTASLPRGRSLVGVRRPDGTTLHLLDRVRRCRVGGVSVPHLVHGVRAAGGGTRIEYLAVEAGTRAELGIWSVDPAGPGVLSRIAPPPAGFPGGGEPRSAQLPGGGSDPGWCAGSGCLDGWGPEPIDGGGIADPGAAPDAGPEPGEPGSPVVALRPVPEWNGLRPPAGVPLGYRPPAADGAPAWLRTAIDAAVEDAARSRRSRAPVFRRDPEANGVFRYTTIFPAGPCADGIACATWSWPDTWQIRIRAHGFPFRWGTLRWCQVDPSDGCFDVERVILHELGHIIGLGHPESEGWSLPVRETVMQHITPARPAPGSAMHAFGPCDVATLQERFDLPTAAGLVSTCNDPETELALTVDEVPDARTGTLTFRASLRIVEDARWGRLAGNRLAGRQVELQRRPLDDPAARWSVFWMREEPTAGRYSLALVPDRTAEYRAVLRRDPEDGIRPVTSDRVVVRGPDGCVAAPCPLGGEDGR